jgi:hypothetical protein
MPNSMSNVVLHTGNTIDCLRILKQTQNTLRMPSIDRTGSEPIQTIPTLVRSASEAQVKPAAATSASHSEAVAALEDKCSFYLKTAFPDNF